MALTRITKGVIKPNENYDTHNINSTGIVTAIGLDINGNGDISGNLSVGGVLTYEDVTSIDSVGIITAQKDIHVGAGVSAVGVGTFGSLDIGGDIDVDGHTNLDNVSVAGVTTFASNVNLGDNDKIILGSGNRFSIYDNGTSAIIDNTYGSGSILRLGSANQVVLGSPLSNNQTLIRGVVNGPSELYHAGAKKLETYTSGINVTGNTVADGLTIDGDSDLNGDLDVDGHTNLDNVSIAGVTTTTGNIHLNSGAKVGFATDSNTFIGQDDYDRLDFNVGGKRLASIVEGTNIPVLVIDKDGVNTARSNQNTNYNANPHGTDLVLGNTSSNNHGLTIVSPSTNYGVIFFSDGSGGGLDATRGSITFTHSDNKLTLKSKIGSIALNHKDDEKLITTDAGISILKDLDVDGHTNLDNVSIAGVTTFTGRSDHSSSLQMLAGNNIVLLNDANSANCQIDCYGGAGFRLTSYNQTMFTCENGNSTKFYTDSGTSRLEITNGGDVLVNTGTLHIPDALTHLGDTDTKIRFPSADTISFETGGAERLRITSNGRVNIGTGNLNQTDRMLNVYGGRIRIEGISSGNSFEIMNSASAGSSFGMLIQAGTNSSDVNSTFRNTSGSTLFRIRGDGNIGINQTSPSEKLEVYAGDILLSSNANGVSGGIGPNAALKFEYNGHQYAKIVGNGRDSSGYGDIDFYTSPSAGVTNLTQRMTIRADGKIGIGEDNPESNHLLIRGSSTVKTKSGHIMLTGDGATVNEGPQIVFSESGSGSNYAGAYIGFERKGDNSQGDLIFGTRGSSGNANTVPTERVRLTSTGQFEVKSDLGIFVKSSSDNAGAQIRFSTSTQSAYDQIGHIKYYHGDNSIVSGYGEGFIVGGTETNGFILRLDGALNIKDSDSAGGDGAKLLFGTDKDMRMYHSGGDGFLDGTGVGGLRVRYNDIIFSNYTNSGTRRVRFYGDEGIEIYTVTNAAGGSTGGAIIAMSDASDFSQVGKIRYVHSNNSVVNDGTDECFVIEGSETQTALKLDGRFYISDDKFVMKPNFGNFDKIPTSGTSDGTNHQGVMMRCDNGQSSSGNSGIMSNNAYEPLILNRTGSDGTVIRIRHLGNTEGEVKVNGSSVTYGNFMGSHKAQFVDHSKPDLLIGTVMEAVDQIATWKYASFSVGVGTDATTKFIPYYGSKNDGETDTITFESNTYNATIKNHRDPMPEITKHVCVKVSDTVGSKAVFGVFNCWQEENVVERESSNTEYAWNDLDVASIGNYFIRMQSGQTPAVGDYVESAGDGTAKVQSDDILRSKTIAKITSTTKQKTYDDGSFLVTCTLHCG